MNENNLEEYMKINEWIADHLNELSFEELFQIYAEFEKYIDAVKPIVEKHVMNKGFKMAAVIRKGKKE